MGLNTNALALVLSLCTLFAGTAGELFADIGPESTLVLINREHALSYDYVPAPLVTPNVRADEGKEDNILMRPEAAAALEALFAAAEKANVTLYAVSGYRTYYEQRTLFERKAALFGERQAMLTVAPQGTSEHQLGLAMDLNGASTLKDGLEESFGASPEGQWLYAHAHEHGFIIRYPKDKTEITGYAWEPWHIRYVGAEVAEEIYTLDITFEEYHALLQQARIEAWAQMDAEGE
ncbi:MAG: M15 family metallopeptidase [Oscillospiraceae bacterium]|jgi:LAS superfamily LD-carboxypeptidase LdcB|nr:M15 family metallopeptidase [Oscillospiraceae bacterium]